MATHNRHEDHCKHEVSVCDHCDVAYCAKCKREWGAPCNLQHYAPFCTLNHYPTVVQPYNPFLPMIGTGMTPLGDMSGITVSHAETPALCTHN